MKRISIIILLLPVLLLSACKQTLGSQSSLPDIDISEVTFERSSVLLKEARPALSTVPTFELSKTLDTVTIDGITYGFDPTISQSDREAYIESTMALLEHTGNGKLQQLNVYLPITYDEIFVQDGSIYTYTADRRSADYICGVLYGVFGEYCNHGMIYGYASYLANAIYGTEIDRFDNGLIFNGNYNTLDLGLLCFDDHQEIRRRKGA